MRLKLPSDSKIYKDRSKNRDKSGEDEEHFKIFYHNFN